MDVTQLREGLLSGKFSSEDLVNVFAARCYTIGRRLCLSTEENFEEALSEARVKDAERKAALQDGTADQLPPLHGIPISAKEMVSK
jgi:Asp-tRNA(Asn)/Glu-tRNA(Gln) amidotransferase A subunit family amidase